MRVTWQRNKRVEDFGTELRTQASSLFRTAAAVVWLLSIFQSRRGKRDKPEDVASTCPVSVKTHLQTYFAVFHVVEKKGKKLRPHKRAPKELDRFLILQLGRREREREYGPGVARVSGKIWRQPDVGCSILFLCQLREMLLSARDMFHRVLASLFGTEKLFYNIYWNAT